MWSTRARPERLALASLVLAGLACQTATRLPELISDRGAPTPGAAAPLPTAPQSEDISPPITTGPVVGTPRETRIAITEQVDSLEDLAAETYSDDELDRSGARATYTIAVEAADTRLLWGFGWCASDPDTLAQNLEQMKFEFLVNGQPVDLAQFDMVEGFNDENQACRAYRAVVYNWPAGASTLETRVTFLEDVNDGFSTYPAGDMVFTYQVTAP